MASIEVKVPDIGDFDEVSVIELLVKPGDTVKAEQSLVTVESDKASMEIPSSQAGVVKELKVKLGDKVKEGSVLLVLESAGAADAQPAAAAPPPAPAQAPRLRRPHPSPPPKGEGAQSIEIRVPDIGDFKDVAVIELLVKPGDTVKVEQSLLTVESDKASMEIPSSAAGVIKELKVKIGDKVNIGDLIAVLEGSGGAPRPCRSSRRPSAGGQPRRLPRQPSAHATYRGPATARAGHAHRPAAACIAVGAQVRPRTGRSAGRGEGHRPEGPHHAGGRAGLHQGRDEGRSQHQGSGGQGARRRRRRGAGPAALAQGGLRQVRSRRAQGRWRASRRSAAPTCTATG